MGSSAAGAVIRFTNLSLAEKMDDYQFVSVFWRLIIGVS
jgi:hypothetical protein